MTKEQAIEYAVQELPNILPLDSDQIKDLCEQTIKENGGDSERIAQALFEILGQDDLSVHFIFEFNERLMEPPKSVKPVAPVKPVSPVKPVKSANPVKPVAPVAPVAPVKQAKPETSTVRSDHHPVKESAPRKTSKDSKEIRLESLKDIDDVLKMLELRSGTGNPEQYKCNCQGTRHPIFDPAPNCLHCGKIICVKEGLHMNNCSFCQEELIPREERENIMKLLQMEKEHIELKKVQENMPKPKPKQTKKYKITSGAGTNLWKEQEKMLQRVEKDRNQERETKRQQILNQDEEAGGDEDEEEQLKEARMRLEKLLHYQDTSAERTKIIDNASDFALNEDVMWGSAYERALQLKKQQRNLRKWEKIEKERNGRREKIVLDLTIGKDGKVVMTEAVKKKNGNGNVNAASDDEFDDISDEEDLQDLEDIHNLKAEISSQREQERSKLQSRVWDYKKAQAEFSKPVYVPGPDEQTEKVPERPEVQKKVHRVQVGDNDRPSLQDNILAIL